MFASDALFFLADFGDAMSWTPSTGGTMVAGQVLFDEGDSGADGGNHISREYTLTLETAGWVGLKRGEQVVVLRNGAYGTYKLRTDLAQQDDAVFSTVKLSKVS
jgi:hypothetical protein